MGQISNRHHRKLAGTAKNLSPKAPKRRPNMSLLGKVRDVQALIGDGLDPVHAACPLGGAVRHWLDSRPYPHCSLAHAKPTVTPRGRPGG
jgi:hypothetical protein